MEKTYRIIKTILFGLLGVCVLVFNELFIENECQYLPILVGSVMAYYGLEAIISVIVKHEVKKEMLKAFNGAMTLMLGVIVLSRIGKMAESMAIVGVLWSVWAIMREGEEIVEKVVETWDVKLVSIINAVESIAVIILSVSLMLNPVEHHMHSHVILLGIELILEVTWGYLYRLFKPEHTNTEKE